LTPNGEEVSERLVTIVVDGRDVRVPAGASVAVALLGAGIAGFRKSVRGEARGPLCGMGICYECRVSIDGTAHRRACMIAVVEGLTVSTGFGASP
jgi:predicted molibdopterin-dependent oxidoreductase YjgC